MTNIIAYINLRRVLVVTWRERVESRRRGVDGGRIPRNLAVSVMGLWAFDTRFT